MIKVNSNSKGRSKPRHSGGSGNGHRFNGAPTSRNSVFDSNGPCGKIRGNVSQIIERYQTAAKDAITHGEYVLGELCMQYADHYTRISQSFSPEMSQRPRREEHIKAEDAEIETKTNLTDVDLSIPDFSAIGNS